MTERERITELIDRTLKAIETPPPGSIPAGASTLIVALQSLVTARALLPVEQSENELALAEELETCRHRIAELEKMAIDGDRIRADLAVAYADRACLGVKIDERDERIRELEVRLAGGRAHQRLLALARSVSVRARHEPRGSSASGPCARGCVKCEADRIVAEFGDVVAGKVIGETRTSGPIDELIDERIKELEAAIIRLATTLRHGMDATRAWSVACAAVGEANPPRFPPGLTREQADDLHSAVVLAPSPNDKPGLLAAIEANRIGGGR